VEIDLGGGLKIESATDAATRLTALLWGPAGCGKTTLAASAPGKILWINFDPEGLASLTEEMRKNVHVLDLSNQTHAVVEKFKQDDPFGLSKVLSNPDMGIESVVVDSATSFAQLAVERGISLTKGATLERPSPGAYGARNALTLRLISSMLRLTGKYNKHCIIISHEDAPTTDNDGNVLYISIMLGGKLPDQVALQISEVWWMQDTGKERRIAVRPCRTRKPMKSRMFDASSSPEFILKFDPFKEGGLNGEHSLSQFYQNWIDNGKNKIQLPK
jgi:hypothetical protein